MDKLVIVNEKGGVGKSTSAVSLAHGLAIQGKRTLLIDLDAQAQCCTLLGLAQDSGIFDLLVSEIEPERLLRGTGRENLTILPADKRTGTVQRVLVAEGKPISYLGDRLGSLKFDYLIFDTAPSLGILTNMAIYYCDYFLVPTACDYLSSEGVFRILDTAEESRKTNKGGAELLGILPTFFDEVTRESKETIEYLNERFDPKVLDPIHRATVLRECSAYGKTIFEVSPKSRSAKEYTNLVNYVLEVV